MRDGVVLLHGLGRTAGSMRPLERAFETAGYGTLRLNYRSRSSSLETIVADLSTPIGKFAEAHVSMHIVTHSLGGIVARALLDMRRPPNLGRVVMLAPPHGGSEWVDLLQQLKLERFALGPVSAHLSTRAVRNSGPIDYPLGIIAGNRALDPIFPRFLVARPNDGKVSVASTRLAGMSDHIVMPVSHTLMTANRAVGEMAVRFIETGKFPRE
jgi:pimeloyl-ACP methyl ester carboxylesterase